MLFRYGLKAKVANRARFSFGESNAGCLAVRRKSHLEPACAFRKAAGRCQLPGSVDPARDLTPIHAAQSQQRESRRFRIGLRILTQRLCSSVIPSAILACVRQQEPSPLLDPCGYLRFA
jgi:hypothetical protein